MSAITLELTDGTTLTGTVLAKALNVVVFYTTQGKFVLVSSFMIKDTTKL